MESSAFARDPSGGHAVLEETKKKQSRNFGSIFICKRPIWRTHSPEKKLISNSIENLEASSLARGPSGGHTVLKETEKKQSRNFGRSF